ncbi:MAG: hypothetical protein R6T99_10050 [Bacteroidales bacterium]
MISTRMIAKFLTAMIAITSISCDRSTNLSFEDWDLDNNGTIEQREFVDVFSEHYYDDWNTVNNEYLDDEDFYHTVYNVWDIDDDEAMVREEWIAGYDYFYGDYVVVNYEDIDVNNDEVLLYDEFYNVLRDTDFYHDWDLNKDAYLSDEELGLGLFHIWDVDNSGKIEYDEYVDFDLYYTDF